jgi:hypothetical protein
MAEGRVSKVHLAVILRPEAEGSHALPPSWDPSVASLPQDDRNDDP